MPALLGAGASDDKRSAETYARARRRRRLASRRCDDEERLEFRDALTRFVRTYSFVSQIAAFTDPALERDYVYCRALSLYLRDTDTVERLDLGDRGRADPPAPSDDLQRHAVADVGGRRGPVVLRRGQGQPAGAGSGAPVQHRRGAQRALRHRPDRCRQAACSTSSRRAGSPTENCPTRPRTTASRTSAWSSTASSSRRSSPGWTPTSEIFKKILDDEDFRATLGDFYLERSMTDCRPALAGANERRDATYL